MCSRKVATCPGTRWYSSKNLRRGKAHSVTRRVRDAFGEHRPGASPPCAGAEQAGAAKRRAHQLSCSPASAKFVPVNTAWPATTTKSSSVSAPDTGSDPAASASSSACACAVGRGRGRVSRGPGTQTRRMAEDRSARTEAALAAQLPRDTRSSSSMAARAASASVIPPTRRRSGCSKPRRPCRCRGRGRPPGRSYADSMLIITACTTARISAVSPTTQAGNAPSCVSAAKPLCEWRTCIACARGDGCNMRSRGGHCNMARRRRRG